ncbi:MAG: hypothetical protein KA230_09830 [Flavobacteriales bacterium]|nr:hypothetical protein [Flavobacteriales bacterium]
MKRSLLLLLLPMLLLLELPAQGFGERKWPDLIPLDGKIKRGGFYFAPGVTYALARGKDREEEVYRAADTSYTAIYDPNGRIGLYLEAGWFHATRDPVILDYWDFGLAYKQLKGTEDFTGILQRGDSVATIAGSGAFRDQYLTVHFNANKFFQTGRYQFVQLSLGLNGDLDIGSSRAHTGDPILNQHEFPPGIIAQAHLKLGYGFKMTHRLFVIPAVETPVFSVLPEDQGFGQLQWFSSPYRPLILSIRFLFLRYPNGIACPPVRISDEDKRKHKVYKEQYTRP